MYKRLPSRLGAVQARLSSSFTVECMVTSFGVKAQVASVNREKNEVVLTIDKSTKAQMTVTLASISHIVGDENKKTESEKTASDAK